MKKTIFKLSLIAVLLAAFTFYSCSQEKTAPDNQTITVPDLGDGAFMVIDSTHEHWISLRDAKAMTKTFRDDVMTNNTQTDSVVAVSISKDIIEAIFAQPLCEGLISYFAVDDGKMTLIHAGVDVNGNVMYDGILAEHHLTHRCPTICAADGDLSLNDQ